MVNAVESVHRLLFSRQCGMIVGLMFGVITVLLRSMGLDVLRFDPTENEVFFFFCMVPVYMFTGFLALRYVGGYLVRTWLKELLVSPLIRRTVVDLVEQICKEKAMPILIAKATVKTPLVDGARDLTERVVRDRAVRQAATKLVVAVLSSEGTHRAIKPLVKDLVLSEGLRGGLTSFLRDRKLVRPISDVAQAIVCDEKLHHSLGAFIEKLFSDDGVRKDLKDAVKVVLADPEIHSSVVKALYTSLREAIFGQVTAAVRNASQPSRTSADHKVAGTASAEPGRSVECSRCYGFGERNGAQCPKCHGSGRVEESRES